MGFGWQEIDKTLDLGYIRVAGLHRECKPTVLLDPPNFRPRTMTHIHIHTFACIQWNLLSKYLVLLDSISTPCSVPRSVYLMYTN